MIGIGRTTLYRKMKAIRDRSPAGLTSGLPPWLADIDHRARRYVQHRRGTSGVGLYSREILFGLAAAHPETRFQFCYRPHRYFRSWHASLPPNAARRLLAEPLGPRSADVFHGLNQRLPHIRLRRPVTTFHDLFVLTGEYSTAEIRARFAEQARDAAARSAAIIAVSEFTKQQAISLLGVDASKVRVVHHGIRALPGPVGVAREKTHSERGRHTDS